MNIAHVIPSLSLGNVGQSLIELIRHSSPRTVHRVVALELRAAASLDLGYERPWRYLAEVADELGSAALAGGSAEPAQRS